MRYRDYAPKHNARVAEILQFTRTLRLHTHLSKKMKITETLKRRSALCILLVEYLTEMRESLEFCLRLEDDDFDCVGDDHL